MWKYKIGTVVREKDGAAVRMGVDNDARPMFGHIVGFSNNTYETTLKVQWDDSSIRSIHPSNVYFEDDIK